MKTKNKYLRYTILYVAASCAMVLILFFMQLLIGSSGNGAISTVVPLILGMQVGQWYFEGDATPPTSQEKWRDAFRFGALGFLISLVLSVVVIFLAFSPEVIIVVGLWGGLAILAAFFVVSVLCTRVGIWLGVQGALQSKPKAQRR